MVYTFGIRHHGPGSTKRLLKALEVLQVDCILVEAPYDSEKSLLQINTEGFVPPVALLMYNPKDFVQAAYLPFASFSPEWQAIQYALKQEIPVRAMDLPMGIQLEMKNALQLPIERESIPDLDLKAIAKDPLGFMAKLAGYQDSERWWEQTFEQEDSDLAVFTGINEMMKTLREELGSFEKSETLIREAHMRKILRKTIKEGYTKIAVVCGAWHAPSIEAYQSYKSATDNALLRGLKKVNLKASWIPWSYDRLARESGYGAGVVSPAWYELIYAKRKETSIRWMTKAARLFRKEDLASSAAHVIEAVRLADTLATFRGLQIPGIEELEDAAVTVFCEGDPAPMKLIRERLVIGNFIGRVPANLKGIPLQKDFESQVKKARLSSSYQSTERISKELDFRKATQKQASILLHRLNILGIPWGTYRKLSGRELGSFKEKWTLQWRPDYAIRIIQASMYGNTVEEASSNWAQQNAHKITELTLLLDLLGQLQKAALPERIKSILPLIRDIAAQTRDVLQLADAIPSLVNIIRYGSTGPADRQAIQSLLEMLLPRVFIGLPGACLHLEENFAREIFKQILNINSSLALLESNQFQEGWIACLQQISQVSDVHPLLQGIASRVLFDGGYLSIEEAAQNLSLALSAAQEPAVKALWMEGFLFGNAMLIVYHPPLWKIIDDWVVSLPEEQLFETLPLLRRTFAKFSQSERQQLLGLVQKPADNRAADELTKLDPVRMDILTPALIKALDGENR